MVNLRDRDTSLQLAKGGIVEQSLARKGSIGYSSYFLTVPLILH
jgi:hypothetical protein